MLTDKQSSVIKRVAHKCYPFFILQILIFLPFNVTTASSAANLDEVRAIAKMGAVSLALQSIDVQQQTFDLKTQQADWLEWERERLTIYQQGQRWDALQKRVGSYGKGFPHDYYYWAKQHQVDALLKLKQGQQARHILHGLIWAKSLNSEKEIRIHSQWLPQWQKRIIKSYLVENQTSDALLAAQRYYQDYGHNDVDDRLLRARILLINKREEEVVELLMKDTKHPEGGMLYLLAQLRSEGRPPRKVLQSALRQMRGKWADEKLKYMLWAVVAESAKRSGDRPSTANALEFVLAGNKNIELPEGLFDFSADTLWNQYIDYAVHIGNRNQFLIGNDQQWLNAAIKAQKKYPVKARALFAMVMLKGQSDDTRMRAAKGFLNLMRKRKRGANLIMALFLKSTYFEKMESIPAPIRYDIVDIALSRSKIELASSIMTTITSAPDGVDNFQWQLRRARIFVLGGNEEQGSLTLKQILREHTKLERKQIEHFLQVVFDLQTVKKHEHAYQIFNSVLPLIEDKVLQRELYYWMADSKKAQQEYAAAARLYLRSAMHAENNGLDPWGQTARYQVAEMLTKADLLQDAHSIYQQLLDVTREPARRAVLKHELQKLWLLREPAKASVEEEVTE